MNLYKLYNVLLIFITLKQIICQQYNPSQINVQNENRIKISFGSCNKYEEHQQADIFYTLAQQKPDLYIWLGDAAYIDYYLIPHCCFWWVSEQNVTNIYRKFNSTKNDPGYQALLQQNPKIIGMYDDHDANQNDGDKYNPQKSLMKDIYLNFLEEDKSSDRWKANTLYGSYYVGENKKVKVILLDARSERDPPEKFSEKQFHDNLGEQQWKLLENDLVNDNKAELFILGSGYQFIADDKFIIENWYWDSKKRLYELIQKSKKRVILISGDIHYAEISHNPCIEKQYGFQLYEMTSSGLSFSEIDFPFVEYLRHIWVTDNFSDESTRYYGNNFGMIQVEINETSIQDSRVQLQIYGFDPTTPKLEKKIFFKDLDHNQNLIDKDYQCHIKEGEGFKRLIISLVYRLLEGRVAAFVAVGVIILFGISLVKIFVNVYRRIKQFKISQQKKKQQ